MALKSLSTAERYALLKHNKQPSSSYIYPVTLIGKYRRRFRPSWLNQYRWIAYSKKCDGVFCVFCALLGDNHSRATMGSFANEPFRSWNKMIEKCDEQEHAKFHQTSLKVADEFCYAVEHPQAGVLNLLDKKRVENIGRNREILKCITEAILFCAKQCIALRGDIETTSTCTNPGNFLSILKLKSKHNDIFKSHLESPAMKNAT